MMIAGTQGTDRKILAIGLAVEGVIPRTHHSLNFELTGNSL
jgi:hypothetical protein